MPVYYLGKSGRLMEIFSSIGSQYLQSSQHKSLTSSSGPADYLVDPDITKPKHRISSFAVEKSQKPVDFRNKQLKPPGPGAYRHREVEE